MSKPYDVGGVLYPRPFRILPRIEALVRQRLDEGVSRDDALMQLRMTAELAR